MKTSGVFYLAPFLLALALYMAMALGIGVSAKEVTADCAEDLVALSPCLPTVASPPNNNVSSSVSPLCCTAFSAALDSSATCLCHLLRRPSLLGFPINTTALLSLLSLCPLKNANLTADSLQSLCQGSPMFPPLRSSSGNILPNRRSDSGSGSPMLPPLRFPSGSPMLPPLRNPSGNILPNPRSDSGSGFEPSPSPAMGSLTSPQGSDTNSSTPASARSIGYMILPGAYLYLLSFFTGVS